MKKNILVFLIMLFVSTSISFAQSETKQKGKITYKLKMAEAHHLLLGDKNYRAALNIYRELLTDFTNDAMINYRIGECYLALNSPELAVEYFQNARKLKDKPIVPELHYNLGIAYHKNLQLDLAIESLEKFKATAKKSVLNTYNVSKALNQVNYAKKMKEHPVNVEIEILSENINSRGADYAPSITADGKTMIFTSRRSDTKGGGIDKAGDYKYFEDIYLSTWDSTLNNWGKAYPIEGNINTEGHDASLSISPDGNEIYIYRNDGSIYIGDIFVSKKRETSGKWSTPKPLDKTINTSYYESSASLSADGNKLFFVSERKEKKTGAQGKGDIYVVEKISKSQWGEPKNLGPIINTPEDEIAVFIHPDGKTLFFSSKGHLSMGGYDVFISKFNDADSTWSIPQNLGYPINTVNDDIHFILSLDGKTAYYSNELKEGMGERDIYKINMINYPVLTDGVAINLSILKGEIKSNEQTPIVADFIFKDNTGKEVAKTTSNTDGEYFITLKGGFAYSVSIQAEGYQSKTISIDLGVGKNSIHTQIENIVLEN